MKCTCWKVGRPCPACKERIQAEWDQYFAKVAERERLERERPRTLEERVEALEEALESLRRAVFPLEK